MAAHRLLVVEDDILTLQALRTMFSRMGWQVSAVSRVADGLAALEEAPAPCCLILDLDLPDGCGERVLERVRERGLETHVSVCTGSMDGERLRFVASLEPDALLTKPVTITDLWKGICRICDTKE